MKRIIMTMMAILSITMSANAMSYEQARREALFLTDKMAYELNLNDSQYEAAYEINLDYLMGVTSRDDVYGTYWTRRNLDLSYILLDWQWNAFLAANYFYRPLYWNAGYWHFGIYARYPRRDYFYFHRPAVYVSYCGGHSWHNNGGHSYYKPRRNDFHSGTAAHVGMRDRWNNGGTNRNTANRLNSSTRVTVNNNGQNTTNRPGSALSGSKTGGTFGGSRTTTNTTSASRVVSGTQTGNTKSIGSTLGSSKSSGSFGTSRTAGTSTSTMRLTPVRSTTSSATPTTRTTTGTSRTGGTFGTSRTATRIKTTAPTPTRPTSTATRSFGTSRSMSTPARSVSSSPSPSRSTGNSSNSSGKFGGRR